MTILRTCLAYADDPANRSQTANQDRTAYSGGGRLDHTWIPTNSISIKTGFQIDHTNCE